ncbi:MAG: 2Fe-2S iron-sulfur cluster-binding protein [Terriglobales bacterium]
MLITIDGRKVDVQPGVTVAAAVVAAAGSTRRSVRGEARAPLCAMGTCFECRVTINGRAHQRGCQIQAAPGMDIATTVVPECSDISLGHGHRAADVVIVGAGPAGLAAAAAVVNAGRRAIVVDDNPAAGGQIWRAGAPPLSPSIELHCRTRIVDQPAAGLLRAETPDGIADFAFNSLVLATGARERFLPFPGWTLPHVLGAGGLQAMVKGGLPISGRRVVVAGTGPLLPLVAAYLRQHGATILAICEQAEAKAMMQFLPQLPPSKVLELMKLAPVLAGIPVWTSTWPIEAQPGEVTLSRWGKPKRLACDYLACGFHLVPNVEMALLLGCAMQNGCVVVNDRQQTNVAGVYCAGEPTGVGGVELAQAEGTIAGLAAAGVPLDDPRYKKPRKRRDLYRRFAERLDEVCRLRPELRDMPTADTIVCRCEDVTWGQLTSHPDARAAKLLTRCGMGPCQGRVCATACEFLLGWSAPAVRPPLYPAPVAALAASADAK